tara:strand:- start:660 stop:953 length:294 start_codon:yes stop_codon:yes gene_type:complete
MDYIYWKWTRNEKPTKTKREVPVEKPLEIKNTITTPEIDNIKNKREECCERISNREWVIQKNINPYLNGNNYINDLTAQNEFLIPKDSNFRKKISLT